MAEGLKIRAEIDNENVKGLLLINGGAAVALLAFLPTVLDKPGYDSLAMAVLWGMLFFQAGLIFAVTHNHFRRKCSLVYEQHNYSPPPCNVLGFKLNAPCICRASMMFMWLSVVAFCGEGVTVFIGGYDSLSHKLPNKQEVKASPPLNQKASPTPSLKH